MSEMEDRLKRLRGKLSPEEPGARGLEKVARNPRCARLKALAIAGISPHTASTEIYGEPVKEGQSPFAINTGNSFEQKLYSSGAAGLLRLYRDLGRLKESECKVLVIPDLAPGHAPHDIALRRSASRKALQKKLARAADAPNLIIQPRLPVVLLGLEHDIEPDALVASDDEPFYRPVEVKSYPDREGKTDPSDLRSACRQVAVAIVALRLFLEKLGADPSLVSDWCDLVLRKPGWMLGSLREMRVSGELDSIERALREAPDLEELEQMLLPGAALDDKTVLECIPNYFTGDCKEHCALATCCKQEAVRNGSAELLGPQARETLAGVGTLSRALELLHRRGTPPRTEEERVLASQLQEAFAAYQEGLLLGR